MTFDDFLIKSYYSPFFKQPFPKEMEEYLQFMDNIADYLCTLVKKSSDKPLISVIIPVYNRKDKIMNAINSVLSQSYDNFELIIVDDASTDGTVEFLKEIQHEKIRVFFHTENKDSSGARNTGLKEANGEYITYLDSDNLMDEKFLESNLGMFLKFPDADCVYSAQSRHDEYDSPAHTILFGTLNKSGLLNRNFIDMNTIFHKKEVLEKVEGFDETLTREEDWDFILKICNNYKIYCAPILQSKYYTHIMRNRRSVRQTNSEKIRENNAKFYTDCSELDKKVNIIIPINNSQDNLRTCLNSILYLYHGKKIKIIISNNNSKINLNDLNFNSNIEIIETKTDLGFGDSLKKGLEHCDKDGDILILNQKANLTKGSIESMQKYAYELKKCGLIASQQIMRNSPQIKKYFTYVSTGYWIDTTPFEFENNIVKVPLFYDGDILELRVAPFFCTYIKRDVLDMMRCFNFKYSDEKTTMSLLSNFIRHNLGLKIFDIYDSKVFRTTY